MKNKEKLPKTKRRLRGREEEARLTLAGVPNVGKSTVFNALTGMRQHTGNWTGKTVECAVGRFVKNGVRYTVTDLPGTYSLFTHSAEEDRARDFIMTGGADVTVVVCDGSCPERSLVLALQILELTHRCVIFFNLSDEAKKRGIRIDTRELSRILAVPVLTGTAKSKRDVERLLSVCTREAQTVGERETEGYTVRYPREVEAAVEALERSGGSRREAVEAVYGEPEAWGLDRDGTRDKMAQAFDIACAKLCRRTVEGGNGERLKRDVLLDRLFTGKYTAFPVMALLILFVFWLTVKGANYPSAALWRTFCALGEQLRGVLSLWGCPAPVVSLLTDGVYRVTSWVVSVMLVPMAIFFPLFTLLEDLGYLPRVAFDLDRCFKGCGGCGKQALCICMGLGCNAVGVTGCRIIDSPRERLIAILTNSMVPCNGKFPAILTLSAVFLSSGLGSAKGDGTDTREGGGLATALVMLFILVLCAAVTLVASAILSKTLLRGKASSFALELPSYRVPRVAETLVRSVLDRTVFVLGRAVAASVPAGALIWLLANVTVGGGSLLFHINGFLEPVGRLMGLDGVILTAFVLGLPANETVLPMILMSYLARCTLPEADSVAFVSSVLRDNGWSLTTAACTVVFSLFHWPCATTLMTVKKETGSLKWTLLSALYPTAFGFLLCVLISLVSRAVLCPA